jgi:Mn2+/Fe2+ NRAMP family transporter
MAPPPDRVDLRTTPSEVPRGWARLRWYGPGFTWIVASVGSGSVLFTPRVGARYGYELLWAALVVMLLVWIVIREIGRYTVVSGRTILDGFHALPGPRGWAVWLIFVPQMVASSIIVAGIAALVGSALMISFPGSHAMYSVAVIVASCVLVISGRYHRFERVSTAMAAVLVISALVTAVVVRPDLGALASGAVPAIPADFDLYFVIPWLSFVVAGPAALLWYSYWLIARAYAGAPAEARRLDAPGRSPGTSPDNAPPPAAMIRLRGWSNVMARTAAIGVFGGGAVSIAFLVLGSELLAPAGVIPEGIAVAEDLTRLLSEVWGAAGEWLLIGGVVIALWGSVLANQDGFGRLYADATLLLLPARWFARLAPRGTEGGSRDAHGKVRRRLGATYTIVVLTIAPLVIFFVARDPVQILSVGGILAAAHMPLVVVLTLYLNRTRLPGALRPSTATVVATLLAGLFYLVVAAIFFIGLLR